MSGKLHNAINRRAHSEVPSNTPQIQESATYSLHAPVLVLNASYEPINVCAARRAPGVSSTLGDTPARVSPDTTPDAGTVREKYHAHRPQHLSVLRRSPAIERTHARPRDAAVTRRIVNLGKPGGLLSSL